MSHESDHRELIDLAFAVCDGVATEQQIERIEELLAADPAARLLYLQCLEMHFDLDRRHGPGAGTAATRWSMPSEAGIGAGSGFRAQGPDSGIRDSGFGVRDSRLAESPAPSPEPPVPSPEPLIPPIVIDDSSPFSHPLFSIHSPLGGWLISYGVATLLTGVAILGAWLYRVSHDYQVAEAPRPASPTVVVPETQPESVARISGAFDCQFSGPQSVPVGTPISLGRRYELASGLLEISYQSGAKVILEGPCAYEVNARDGGFLSLGKLTAKVERSEVRGQGSEVRNQKSDISNPQSLIPNPLFVVRTPTAVVTDLGTEFGVEVERSGTTRSHVFRGKVEVRVHRDGRGDGEGIFLGENESARVEVGPEQSVKMIRSPGGERKPGRFAREMPKPVRMSLFSTGVGMNEGDPDPHWQLAARSDNPHFKPRPAVVTSLIPANRERASVWDPNDPALSQWISTANHAPELPNGVIYTFRTRFELPGLVPGRAAFHGWFAVDNEVRAIRLNGRPLEVPKCNFDPRMYHSFAADTGFVAGTNTLEFDVYNGSSIPGDDVGTSGPMLLRVELEGTFVGTAEPPANARAAATGTTAPPPQPRADHKPKKGDQFMNGP